MVTSGPDSWSWPRPSATPSTPGCTCSPRPGTGTGKSLGYLAPTLVRFARGDLDRVVVTTATLALQSQLASKDIPHALDAVESVTGRRPRHAILKGRTNYACLLKVRDGADDQAALIPASELVASLQESPRAAPESALGSGGAGAARVGRGAAGRRGTRRPR